VTERFATARLSEIGTVPSNEDFSVVPLRLHFGIEGFGVNAYTVEEAGAQVIEEHDELGSGAGRHEELYLVVEGHATFTVDGEEVDAPAGTLVYVRDPAARRTATARSAGTTVLVVGGTPGVAFRASPWEFWLAAHPAFAAGDYERAAEIAAAGLELHPGNPSVLYNLACYESLAGRREQALEHLRLAVETDPKFAGYAATDSDLDAIRDEPGFPR
jgi:tetratricopeptide (TPR) repeat protein